jgi:phosphatidylglycerol:prolipoprotein diacylglycerol transferase
LVRRTLFYIPDEVGGWPMFGWGWALGLWLIVAGATLLLTARRRGWDRETLGQLPMVILVAAAIIWLLPRIVEPVATGIPVWPPVTADAGLPIRGYGVMLLLAVTTGVGLACVRAVRAGLAIDVIFGLAFVMVLSGMIGARLFFVIQYWSLLRADTWTGTLANLMSVDKGGLVVYGSLIGALLALGVFAARHRLPLLPLGDLIAPSLALGLALGRLGCLLNGCCYGGPCEHAWAVRFPAGSPPYEDQQGWGMPYGFRLGTTQDGAVAIESVAAGGPAERSGVTAGMELVDIDGQGVHNLNQARAVLEKAGPELTLTSRQGRPFAVSLQALPERSQPIHPTQIYSAVNAALLCLLAWALYPFRRKHGQVLAALLTLYAITRFLLEIIRSDEGSFLATLTISQNISIAVGLGMLGLWLYIQRQPDLTELEPNVGPSGAARPHAKPGT